MTIIPRVAIVGRANVGKSTLFNRLTHGPKALVSPMAGTTRDRKEGVCLWRAKRFLVTDTGGLDLDPKRELDRKVALQAQHALADASAILFVVSAHDGIMPQDLAIAKLLRTIKKPVLLVANKSDNVRFRANAAEFYRLGFGDPHPVSAVSGAGSGDLLDILMPHLKAKVYKEETGIPVAIIGKPNVGKSSLLNALVGAERSIVHDEPYTTRDANEIRVAYKGSSFIFLDTAGIRKKSAINPSSIERESLDLSHHGIRRAAVIIFVTEANKPLTAQDRHIAALAEESNASIIIVANKWDLVGKQAEDATKRFTDYYRRELNFIWWAPLMFLSAAHKTKITSLKDTILEVYEERFRKITDNALSKHLVRAIKRQPPTIGKGTRKPYIKKITQEGVNPPQFVVHMPANTSLRYSYLNFLARSLREYFGFEGAPVKVWIQKDKR